MAKRLITIGLEFYYDPRANQIIPPILPDPELHELVKRFLHKAQKVVANRGLKTTLGCVLFEVPGVTGRKTKHPEDKARTKVVRSSRHRP
jgi:hypothetical protein